MSLRAILVAIVLVWVGFAVLGALLHAAKLLLYAAALVTLALLALGALRRWPGRRG